MSKRKQGRDRTDWDQVDQRSDKELTEAAECDRDNPPLGREQAARLRPAHEAHPQLGGAYKRGELRRRGPQKAPTKVPTTVRLDPDVLEHFKSTGRGWQTRLNDALRKAIGKG